MASYYVTSDPQIVADRVIHVPVVGVSASVMKSAFINAIGVGIRKLEEKRAKNFKFYEGTLAGGGRISFVPVAMINDVLHAAGVISWY
jgi:hypothetical protein